MKYVCVRSSVHVNPTQDFNEWAEYTFNQVKQNYKSKIKSNGYVYKQVGKG